MKAKKCVVEVTFQNSFDYPRMSVKAPSIRKAIIFAKVALESRYIPAVKCAAVLTLNDDDSKKDCVWYRHNQ